MVVLVIAGESIFLLPFVLARVFRPTLLTVFDITNFELGTFFSAYGIVAMVSYLLGGPLADRFPARKLMALALFLTGAGGLYMSTIPNTTGMMWLYGCWGMTTILLFWAAMIKTTRYIGGRDIQGLAFGLLDGGRGLVSALIGSAAVALLASILPDDVQAANWQERHDAFRQVIQHVATWVMVIGVAVWWLLPDIQQRSRHGTSGLSVNGIREVMKLPAVWLQAGIIVCAYSGYKVTDDFSLLASDLLDYDSVKAAQVGTLSLWIRPVAAITAGYLADKVNVLRMMILSFLLMLIGGLLIGTGIAGGHIVWLVFIALGSTALGVFAMRGLYFAIMEEAQIPLHVTGTVVGLASLIGYTPDIFMGPVMGVLLDNSPGVAGHQHVFLLLAGLALLGMLSTLAFRKWAIPTGS